MTTATTATAILTAMASSGTFLVSRSSSKTSNIRSPFLVSTRHFGPRTLTLVPPRSKISLTVTAAGSAKYKGTKMRESRLAEMIEKKVKEATEICEGDERSAECKVAWDEVEEVSQAKADLRVKLLKQDPLESFCQDNPDTDECRIYED